MSELKKHLSLLLVFVPGNPIDQPWIEPLLEDSKEGVELFLLVPKGTALPEALLTRAEHIMEYDGDLVARINQAAIMTSGKYATLVYSDTVLKQGILDRLTRVLAENPESDLAFALLKPTRAEDIAVRIEDVSEGNYRKLEYIDLLYEENPYIQLVWRNDAIECTFDPAFELFARRDFVLQGAVKKPVLLLNEPGGYYLYEEKHGAFQYRQYVYEDELRLKEKHVRHFLNAYDFSRSLQARTLLHSKAISLYFNKLTSGSFENSDLQEFDWNIFMYVLMLLKGGHVKEAKTTLYDYFSLVGNSRNCAHLYRIALTPFLSAPPVITPPTRQTPLVSVPMALYNHGRYLDGALQSLFAQTMPDWELVIINDGSTDDSLHIAKQLIRKYNDPRIRLVSKANEGLPKTRSRGMRETSAPYICQLDADDFIAPDYLEKALQILEHDPEIGWVIPKTLTFGSTNHLTWHWKYDFVRSLIKCPCPALSVFKREAWEDCGGYFQDDMSCREDWEFWIRLGEHGWRAVTMDDVYFIYRHAFGRWGERNKYNISSKLGIIKYHSWWYRKLPEAELKRMFLVHSVGEFPPEILEPGIIRRLKTVEQWNRDSARIFLAQFEQRD